MGNLSAPARSPLERAWRRVQLSFVMLIGAFLLASCGGGEAPGVVTPAPRVPTLSVTMTNGSGVASHVVNREAPLTVTATLVNGSGQPIANSLVQFALSFAEAGVPAVLAVSSGVTDASGKFSTTLLATSATAQGGGTLTATAVNLPDAAPASSSFQVQAISPKPVAPALAIALTDPQSGAARSVLNRSTPLLATATLTDGAGRPLANTLIQFALSFGGGATSALLSPTSGSGVTDASGKFAVSLIAASATASGSGTITATAVNVAEAAPASAAFQVTPTAPPAVAPVVSLVLTDPATGASRNSITLASPLTATARLVDASGRPVANSLVQFSATTAGGGNPVAVLSPASGTGITDEKGEFSVTLQAAGLTSQGAGVIRVTAPNEQNAPTASANFQVGVTSITLGDVVVLPAQIEPLQTATVNVSVTGVPTTVPVTVNFTSPCAATGLATLPSSVVTVNGVATAVYTDKGCRGTDTISVSAEGATTLQTSIRILEPPAVAIQFVSATPQDMSIFGVGGQPTSVVVFKVVNAAQQPVIDLPVTLTLATDVAGVTLDGQGTSVTKRSAQDGTVRVAVVAGSQAGPVRVVATANDGRLRAASSELTIHTSLPVQDRFSLSVETLNIEGWNVDGTATALTIRAADRLGNPVPNGTTINFRASGATIEPTCRTQGGICSVTFRSQANRPSGGRVAVLAWAVGEENFFDTNGNNRYDAGEPFGDLGNAFVDANFNGVFDPGVEEFIGYNAVGSGACAPSSLSAPGVPNTCDGVWGLAHVRANAVVILSGSTALAPNLPGSVRLAGPAETCEGSFSFTLNDVNGNPMPAGTTISASISGGSAEVFGSPVPNTTSATGVGIQLSVPAEEVPGSDPKVKRCQGQGIKTLRLSVTTPLGTTTFLPPVTVIY